MQATLRLLGSAQRQKILGLIWERELAVNEIAAPFDISISAISQHLKKLQSGGLVKRRTEGRVHFYQAKREELGSLAPVLESLWQEQLGNLKRQVETGQKERNASR